VIVQSGKNVLSAASLLFSLHPGKNNASHVMVTLHLRIIPAPQFMADSINPPFMLVAMSSPFLDVQGNPIPQEQVLGNGRSGLILLQNHAAVKTPLRYRWSSDYDVEENTFSLRREQDVYRRLQCPGDERTHGVVPCLEFTANSTHLAYMVNGDLQAYLAKSRPSSPAAA
jgi:hypothetical protein